MGNFFRRLGITVLVLIVYFMVLLLFTDLSGLFPEISQPLFGRYINNNTDPVNGLAIGFILFGVYLYVINIDNPDEQRSDLIKLALFGIPFLAISGGANLLGSIIGLIGTIFAYIGQIINQIGLVIANLGVSIGSSIPTIKNLSIIGLLALPFGAGLLGLQRSRKLQEE